MRRTIRAAVYQLFILTAFATSSLRSAEQPEPAFRQHFLDARLFSIKSDEGIDSYRSHGEGGVGGMATLGLGVAEDGRRFNVEIQTFLKTQRFMGTVTVTPAEDDSDTKALTQEFDFSDLRQQSIDVAKDEDGRVYRLTLTPKIIEHPAPKPFRVEELHLYSWSFPESTVILNDQVYVGKLAMFRGSLAWLDIPGVAKVEFSLLHLKGAKPWGVLEDGTLKLSRQDGTTLRIEDVKNGIHRQTLEGGPYQVWVRWSEPSMSVEEARRIVKERIQSLKERVKQGDVRLSLDALQRLERMSDSDLPQMMSNGFRQVKPEELMKPDED